MEEQERREVKTFIDQKPLGTEGMHPKTEAAALSIMKASREYHISKGYKAEKNKFRKHLLKTVPKDIIEDSALREFAVSVFLEPKKKHENVLRTMGDYELVISFPYEPGEEPPAPKIYYSQEIEETEEMRAAREKEEKLTFVQIYEFIGQCQKEANTFGKERIRKLEEDREKINKRLKELAGETKGIFSPDGFKTIINSLNIKSDDIDAWTRAEIDRYLEWFKNVEFPPENKKTETKALQKEVTRFVPYSKALEKNRHYQQYDWKDDQLDLFEQEDLFKKFEEIEKRLIEKENKNLILGLKDLTEPENKALTAVQSIFYNKGYTLDEGGELEIEETEFFKAYGLEKQGKEGRKEYTGYDKATARKALLSLSTTQRVYIDKDGNKTEFSAGSLCWITFGKELLKEQQKGENKESRPRYENGKLIRRYFKISIHPLVKKGIISDSGKMLITEKGAGASVVYKPEGFNSMFTELLKTRPELFKKGLQRPARLFKGTMDAIGTTDKAFTTPRNFLNYLYLQYTERQGKVKRDHIKWKVLASKIGLAEKTINRTPKQALKILERCFILAENLNLIKPDWELKYGFLDFTILTSAEHYYKPKKDPQPY